MAGWKLILVVVSVFDLVSFGLVMAALQRKVPATIVEDKLTAYETCYYCRYDPDIARGLCIGSLVLFSASQLITMASTRFFFCSGSKARTPSYNLRRFWRISFLFAASWVLFWVAFVWLVLGSLRDAKWDEEDIVNWNPPTSVCESNRKQVLGAAAAMVILKGIASELYYVLYSIEDDQDDDATEPPPPYGITMGNI